MALRIDINDIANILLENAIGDFQKTERFRLLCKNHNRMVEIYESKLTESE